MPCGGVNSVFGADLFTVRNKTATLTDMPDAIKEVTLNGKTGDISVVREWVRALSNERIVQAHAGYLFKALFDGEHLVLAVVPCLIDGERSYHYNQHLGKEDAFTLIGDVNAQGVFTILFKSESRVLSETQKERYVAAFRQFALFLTAAGYQGEGQLDEVTQGILATLGLVPAPQTLAGLL